MLQNLIKIFLSNFTTYYLLPYMSLNSTQEIHFSLNTHLCFSISGLLTTYTLYPESPAPSRLYMEDKSVTPKTVKQ